MEHDFYNFDYIIEINEKRLEQYTSSYQKVLERLTNIIIVYSGLSIFLVPIIQQVFIDKNTHWALITAFIIFSILFVISLFYTVRLIIPIEVAYPVPPKRYYGQYRLAYEADPAIKKEEIPKLLKGSYIGELEKAIDNNDLVFKRKSSFYYNALMYSLLSVAPYLVCLGFYVTKKEDKVQKVEVVNAGNSRILHQMDSMANNKSKVDSTVGTNNSSVQPATQLPGVNNAHIRESAPAMIKENKDHATEKKSQ